MASAKGYLMIISALLFCPCHLPILVAVLAGTAVGAALGDYQGLLVPVMAAYFVAALFIGVRWMTSAREDAACMSCEIPASAGEMDRVGSGERAGSSIAEAQPSTAPAGRSASR